MRISSAIIVCCVAALGGCARSWTVPLAENRVQVTARAAVACGPQGAHRVALRQAAVETIRRGFDRFVVAEAQTGETWIGHVPIVVQMFREGDPTAATALSARETLGPKWPELVKRDALTCLDD